MVGRSQAPGALNLTPGEARFAERAIRRRRLFLGLAVSGVAIAIGLAGYAAYAASTDPHAPTAIRFVLVVLILLNARQNLRQYRFAGILEKRGVR